MSTENIIDMSALPAPDVVETLSFDALLAQYKARLLEIYPAAAAVIGLESDPIVKLLEAAAYRETVLRARVNDAAAACMLAYATGADLDNIAALFGVTRLVVDPGDPEALPPVPATYESDARLRLRTQMSLEGTTVAGSVGAYTFHAITASGRVADVAIDSPTPGTVRVTVLSIDNEGIADAELLGLVGDYLTEEERRPLTDTVVVQAATLVDYSVMATLHLYPGPSAATVLAAARAALDVYIAAAVKLGHDISRSGIFAALHQPGVRTVTLDVPAVDVVIAPTQAGRCTAITLTEGARDV